jgi:murein DD-endopeptidase MepM/ murein hydrolase activator NlpD
MRPQRIVILAFIAMIVAAPVLAQGWRYQSTESGKGRARGGAPDPVACAIGRWPDCDIQQAIARGLVETGLSPVFPAHAKCRGIDEGYAISYAAKRGGREPYHGGIDMPAPWGTPIIAAAAGTVVGKFHGEKSFRGIEIVLRHSPDDTGIPVWTYTQYAHCSEMPALELGQRVRIGEQLCPTGNTGIGLTGAQSNRRRPAIHFAVFFSTSERYAEIRNAIVPIDGYWMDPLALFRKAPPLDSNAMRALPEAEKQVPISIMFDDGKTFPADTKVVWPYTCTRN